MYKPDDIGFIGQLRCRGWALKLYSPLAFCSGNAVHLTVCAERLLAAHIADPGLMPSAEGFVYFEPPNPERPISGRFAAYWWEAGSLHRFVLSLPIDGSRPERAPDAARHIGGAAELALIAQEIAAPTADRRQ